MNERIGVLLAGFGGIGTQDHQNDMYLPAFAARPDFEPVATVDVPGTDGAEKAAREHGLRHHVELDEALADPAVTVVSVAAPLDGRAEVIARAVHAGKHVLADKPMTATLTQAQEVDRLARDRGVVVVPAHHLRLRPSLRAVRNAVRGGRVGLPWNVQADLLVAGGDPSPAGELVNLALYPVDVVGSLLELPVRRVHAVGDDRLVTLMLDHEHGVTSTIVCGRLAGLHDIAPSGVAVHRYRISGSHGVLTADATKPAVLVHTGSRRSRAWTGPDTVDALLDVLKTGVITGRAEIGPADAVYVQRVVQAAQQSLETGCAVRIEAGSER